MEQQLQCNISTSMHIKNQVCSMSVQLWHAKCIPATVHKAIKYKQENGRQKDRSKSVILFINVETYKISMKMNFRWECTCKRSLF